MTNDYDSMSMKEMKFERFKRALIEHSGFVARAADDCNIARSTAHAMIKKDKRLKRLIKELRGDRRSKNRDDSSDYADDLPDPDDFQ